MFFGTKENPFEYGKEESCERNPGGVPFAFNRCFPSRGKGRKANRLPENFPPNTHSKKGRREAALLVSFAGVLVKGGPAV